MHWCRKSLITILIILLFSACTNKVMPIDKKVYENEDQDILFALEYSEQKRFDEAKKIYLRLFDNSKRDEYLLKALKLSFLMKDYKEIELLSQKHLDKKSTNYQEFNQLYILSLLSMQKYDLALERALAFVKEYGTTQSYELAAYSYFYKGDYENASKYYESIYAKNLDDKSLLSLVKVLYENLNQEEKAISYLETHIRLYGATIDLSMKLFSIYKEKNNIDGVISVLNRAYKELNGKVKNHIHQKIGKLLVSYLEVQDIKKAITFLEEKRFDDMLLLELYKKDLQYKKAYKLVKRVYKSNNDLNLFAQMAILEFESAENKKSVLKSVIKKFEQVLATMDNPVYQNFLGYLLIDYNVDIKKGLTLVKNALTKSPDNIAYLDSLAWGEYKLKNCKSAKEIMKKVVEQVGLQDDEIKLHWNKIQECK